MVAIPSACINLPRKHIQLFIRQPHPLRLGLGQGGVGAVYSGLKPWAIIGVDYIVFNCPQQALQFGAVVSGHRSSPGCVNPSNQSATWLEPWRCLRSCASSAATLWATPVQVWQGSGQRSGVGHAARAKRVDGMGCVVVVIGLSVGISRKYALEVVDVAIVPPGFTIGVVVVR
jgi:hypothetical protein